MEHEGTVDTEATTILVQTGEELIAGINQYGGRVIATLLTVMAGVIAIYLIHQFASKFLLPHFHRGRLIKVAGVTFYALILVATALMVLHIMGFDVTVIGQIALASVFVVAVLTFFVLPFLPKLPFQVGHLIEVKGELGEVIVISALFTTLRMYDGTQIFVPNTSILSTTIKNFSYISSRRIEINLCIRPDSDLERVKTICVRLMSEDERVLDEPSPPAVFVNSANAVGIELLVACWVKNEDWFNAQSDLWEKIVNAFDEDIHLAKT